MVIHLVFIINSHMHEITNLHNFILECQNVVGILNVMVRTNLRESNIKGVIVLVPGLLNTQKRRPFYVRYKNVAGFT